MLLVDKQVGVQGVRESCLLEVDGPWSSAVKDQDALGCIAVCCLWHIFLCVLFKPHNNPVKMGEVFLVPLSQRSKTEQADSFVQEHINHGRVGIKFRFSDSILSQTISSILYCFASAIYSHPLVSTGDDSRILLEYQNFRMLKSLI